MPFCRQSQSPRPRIGKARAWSVVLILLLFAILASIDRNAIALMVDPIKDSLAISDFQMGLLQGPAFAVFFLIGSLPMGWIIDKFSNRWALYIGVTAWSLATIACGLAGSFFELLIARCLVGFGEAVLQPAAWSVVTRLFPAHRLSLAIGVLSSGAQIGAAGSYLLGGFLIAGAGQFASTTWPFIHYLDPWATVFIVAGVPGIVLAPLIFLAPAERTSLAAAGGRTAQGMRDFIRGNRAFLTYHFLGFTLHSCAVFGAAAWLPTYLQRNHELDIRVVGTLMALMAVPVGTCGVLFAGWLVDRSFARGRDDAHLAHFARVAGIVAILGGIGFGLNSSALVAIMAFGIIQFLQPFSGVSGAVLQICTPAAYRGRISAAYIMAYNAIGMTVGPSFVAFSSDYIFGPERLGVALGASYAIFGTAAATLLWLGRQHAGAAVRRSRQTDRASAQTD